MDDILVIVSSNKFLEQIQYKLIQQFTLIQLNNLSNLDYLGVNIKRIIIDNVLIIYNS